MGHHVIDAVLKHGVLGQVAMVSSFGAESAALLHLIAITQPDTPVLFIDTNMLFVETLIYQSDLAEQLGLKNLRILRGPQQQSQNMIRTTHYIRIRLILL